MAELLYEHWENPDGSQFGAVSESHDRMVAMTPGARFVFSLTASSYEEAMQSQYDRLGYGTYKRIPGITDQPFSEEQASEQQAYLLIRKTPS